MTRLVNTVAINYHQKDYKVKHLKTIETKEGMEGGPRDTESIKNIGQKLLFAMTFGDNSSMPDYGFEISGGNEKITIDTSYPSSDVTRTRKRDISFQKLNIHVGANLSPVGLDNLALGLLYHLSPNKMDTTINAATPYFYNNNHDELEGEFKMVGWNLVYNLPKTLFVYDFIYLSLGASTITFTMDSANTQVQWNGMDTTVTGPNKFNSSDKLKDYVGGAAILTEKYRAEYYHFLRKNESDTFTEQSESQIDKVEVEAIFGAPEFLHVLGKELYFSAFFLQNINNLIQPQGAADVYMFGVDMGYKDTNNHHAKGAIYYTTNDRDLLLGSDVAKEATVTIEGVHGDVMKTKPILYTAKRTIETCAMVFSKTSTIYNCSDGAKMENTIWLSNEALNKQLEYRNTETVKHEFIKWEFDDNENTIDKKKIDSRIDVLEHNLQELGNHIISEINNSGDDFYSFTCTINQISRFLEMKIKSNLPSFYFFIRGSIWHLLYIGFSHALSISDEEEKTKWIKTWKQEAEVIIKGLSTHFSKTVHKKFNINTDPWTWTSTSEPE